jgi:hypothetical protein
MQVGSYWTNAMQRLKFESGVMTLRNIVSVPALLIYLVGLTLLGTRNLEYSPGGALAACTLAS